MSQQQMGLPVAGAAAVAVKAVVADEGANIAANCTAVGYSGIAHTLLGHSM